MFDKRKWIVILVLFSFLLFVLPINLASASLNQRENNQSAFIKIVPPNGFTALPTLLIVWAGSVGATQYEYCYDTINNSSCDTVWISTTNPSANLTGLSTATYYWQVRATGPNGTVYSNAGTWWSFHVGFVPTFTRTPTATFTITRTPTITLTPTTTIGPFGKIIPHNNGTPTGYDAVFKWFPYNGAVNYEYCYDTSNNNTCDASWLSAGNTTSVRSGQLTDHTTYYWQIRAITASNQVIYPAVGWWAFTTDFPAP